MTIEDIYYEAFPIRPSYSKKKTGRIWTKRRQLKEAIERYLGMGVKEEEDAIKFANYLRENEYHTRYGNENWFDFAGTAHTVQYLYDKYIEHKSSLQDKGH